jgi:hypothetical protein
MALLLDSLELCDNYQALIVEGQSDSAEGCAFYGQLLDLDSVQLLLDHQSVFHTEETIELAPDVTVRRLISQRPQLLVNDRPDVELRASWLGPIRDRFLLVDSGTGRELRWRNSQYVTQSYGIAATPGSW